MENNLPKKITLFDKIRNKLRNMLGYKEGKKFILDTEPNIKDYSYIELMNLANVEGKLKTALNQNKKSEHLINGISEEEANKLMEWVVQNTRTEIEKYYKIPIKEDDLQGVCGVGQAYSAYAIINLGLNPNVNNVGSFTNNKERHAFVTVEVPIKNNDGNVNEKMYLIDTTYRQFFLREFGKAQYVKDKRFGNKVSPCAGYYTLNMEKGQEFAEELLSKGFIELTEENAKIYGDSFVLSSIGRKNESKIPTKSEMHTGISGTNYIEDFKNKVEEIDISYEEIDKDGVNIKTPLMQREEFNESLKFEKVQNAKQNELNVERDI